MESIDLAMEDIFDGGLEEEDLAVPPPLPDLDDDMPAGGEDGGVLNSDGHEAEAAVSDKTPKSAVKKRVLRPQPKLDAERLQSERGLPMLPKLFSNTKFQGKGHEADDLKLVMGRLEHWAHRLFPKLTFDDFSARLEKLGHTKPVQTCIKRIRLDMPVAGDDFTGNPNTDNMSGNEENDAGGNTDAPHGSTMDVEDAYEEMLRQERQQKTATPGGTTGNQSYTAAAGSSSDEFSPRQLPCEAPSKSADVASPPMSSTGLSPQGTPQTKMATSQLSMTPEQLARIERNKQLAMQKRAARLGVPVTALASPKVPSDALSGTMSDVDNRDTPTVTTPHHQVSAVAMTTGAETNSCESNSCNVDAQTADKDGVKSDENRTVIKNTRVQDKTINKCTPDGATQKSASRLGLPVSSVASPKPSSTDALPGTMSDVNNGDTPIVTAPTPPHYPVSAVAMTADFETNTRELDSCSTDAQAADKDGVKSDDENENAVNKCTPDGATMQTEEEILDALESDHDDDNCTDISLAKDDSCVGMSDAKR